MLLLCAARHRALAPAIDTRIDDIARQLVPLARSDAVLAAICMDPGRGRDHAIGHIILTTLGFVDHEVDHLVSQSLAAGAGLGHERLAHRELEQEWLARIGQHNEVGFVADPQLAARSMIGKPIDLLASGRDDLYAFTHAVMYVSDLGGRRILPPRPPHAIAADVDGALGYSLERDDFDLTAELLLTATMLHVGWTPTATFAFKVLVAVQEDLGFLPGSSVDWNQYQALDDGERSQYALTTSYHTGYVMGFLCATALGPGCAPPSAVAVGGVRPGAGRALLRRTNPGPATRRWRQAANELADAQLDSISPMLLALSLRQATDSGDLRLVNELLQISLDHDLAAGPVPGQAAALLRRAAALVAAKSRWQRGVVLGGAEAGDR
jgi:hypothetical protein